MSFSEWSNKKKKEREEEEKKSSQSSSSSTTNDKEEKPSSFTEWSNKKHGGKKGWEQYLADQSSAEQKKNEEYEEKPWWQKAMDTIGEWYGPTGVTDTTIPLGNIPELTHQIRNDTSYTKPSDDWSDEQRYEFGALYLESPEKAYAYAEKTNNANNKAKEEAEIKKVQDSATSNGWAGAAHTAGAIASAGLGLADYLNMLVLSNAGRDPLESDGVVSPFEYSTAVTEGIATDLNEKGGTLNEDIPIIGGKGWGDVYSLGTSIAQSFVSGHTLGPAGTLVSYFGQGAASGMKDALNRGASEGQAALYGASLGTFEAVAEMIGIDNLFKLGSSSTIKGLIKNILNQALAEGAEEGLTSTFSNIADALIMQDKSNFNAMLNAYMEAGMSETEAKWVVFWDSLEGIAYDTIAGAASGGVHGGLQTGIQTGKYSSYVKNAYGGQTQDIVNDALNSPHSSVQEIGQKYQEKLDSGKSLSGWNLYELLETTDSNKIKDATLKRLGELGETSDVTAVAEVLVKQAMGQELSSKDQNILNNSKYGNLVSTELMHENILSDGLFDKWSENIGTRMVSPEVYNKGKNIVAEDFPNKLVTKGVPEESKYKSSESGKTTLKDQEVAIQGIESIKGGEVTVRLENGDVVNASDLEFGSDTVPLMYDMVAKMGVSTNTANELIQHFQPSDAQQASLYYHAIPLAYNYGKIGYNAGLKYITSLSEQDKNYAYRKGVIDAMIEDDAKKNAPHKSKVTNKVREGSMSIEEAQSVAGLTDRQKDSINAVKALSDSLGINIRFFESKVGEDGKRIGANGMYDTETGIVYIDIHAGLNGEGTILYTAAHELTHLIREWSPAKFKVFADFLLAEYGKKNISVDALIRNQIDKAKRNGRDIDFDTAYEEVIADSCESMLADGDAISKIAKLKAKDRSLWQTIKDFITDLVAKIKEAYKGLTPDSVEGRFVGEMLDAATKLKTLWTEALIDAGENYSEVRDALGKGSSIEVNENGEFTVGKTKDGKLLYNDRTYDEGGRETLKETLIAEGFSGEDIKAALTIIDAKHNLVKKLGKEFSEQDKVNKATLTTDLKDGHAVLSALVSNGDYPVNIDLLMVCKKRLAYQKVINRLCETGLIKQATLDSLAIAEINKILGKYGFETACLGCFVESRRIRIQEWAETICKEWNGIVDKMVGKGKAETFNFASETFVKDLSNEEIDTLSNELEETYARDGLHYGKTSVVNKMRQLLVEVPSLRKHLSVADLITPQGRTHLKSLSAELNSLVACRYGSNTPKIVQDFNPYNHEIAKYGKVPSKYSTLREYLYAIGGARMQSFSDFIVENWFDYCQIVADLAARKLPMHTYTKEISLVKLFGMTGIKVNMSLIPDIDRTLPKEFAGLTKNAKGEYELIWADKDRFKATGGKSYMQSINFADALAIQADPRYSANVGTIAVGISDKHIEMMLDDARIRMVIPYHSSGMNPIFANLVGTDYYNDYTNYQNTTVKHLINSKGEYVDLKLTKEQKGKLTAGFEFNEVLQRLGDARAAAEEYKAWCADASLHTMTINGETYTAVLSPKFEKFADHQNYYKLLEDFNTYDCITEQPAPQGDVQQIYPDEFDKVLKDELESRENYRNKQEPMWETAMGEIESYLKKHTKADTIAYAKEHGIKLSKKDMKLSDRDTETVSNRTLLANALDTVAQNDIEKTKLAQYREKIALIESEQVKLSKIRAEIKELSFAKGPRDTARIKSLQFEANQAANRINTYDRQLLNLESTKALKGVLDREKAMARKKAEQMGKESLRRQKEKDAATVRELLARNYESRKKATESRNKTAMRHKIRKVVNELNQLLLHGSKERNVKLGLQEAVAAALDAINMDTVGADERVAKYNTLIAQAKDPDVIASLKETRDRIKAQGDSLGDKLKAMKEAYYGIQHGEESKNYPAYFKEEATLIEQRIQNVIDKVGNTSLRDMSLTQLDLVYDMYKMVLTTIQNANAVWKEGKALDLKDNASAVMTELEEIKELGEEGTKIGEYIRSYSWNEMTPYYAFDRIGSKTLKSFFMEAIRGQNVYANDVAEAKAFADKIRKKYGYTKWDLDKVYEFKLKDGRTFQVTLKHMLSIYAYSKREQALPHMSTGGFFFNDKSTFRKKGGIIELIRRTDSGYKIDAESLAEIKEALGDKVNYVDEMQEYLTKMGEKGNEVTRTLWGIDLFKEKVYFPLKSMSDFIKKSTETVQSVSLKNDGMTKETVPGASNPIVLEAFDDVWASHIDRMSQYHAFVIPIDNLNKIHQYGTWAGTESMAVSTMLTGRFGSAVNEYISQFIKDLNGNVVNPGAKNPLMGFLTKFKKTAVGASLSTMVQQPTAVLRAMADVNAKYFIGKPNTSKLSNQWEELKQYAPIAIIKDIGGFDAGSGVQVSRWLNTDTLRGVDKVMNTIDDFSMKGAEFFDQLGWTSIWEAVKREISATTNLKAGSEEFLKKAGERFTEVIVRTQVYDSTLSRSGYMRSKSDTMKMLTAFMGEPTLSINMMFNAIINAKRGGSKKQAVRTIGFTYASIIAASAMASLIYALRDDDDDESYLEKYMQSLGSEFISDVVLAPITSLPAVKDVASIFQGWDVERTDVAIFKDIKDAFDGLSSETKSPYRKIEDFAGAIAAAFGIPLKNVLRTGREIYNAFSAITDDISGGDAGGAFVEGITGKEQSKPTQLYKAIINGDDARLERIKSSYKDESSYLSAVKSALRANDSRIHDAAQARLDGNISEYTRIAREIIAEGHFSQDIVVAAINSEMNVIKKDESTQTESTDSKDEVTSIYRADDINIAFDNGDTDLALSIIDELVEMKMANGMDEKKAKSSIRSSMTSYWKPLYKQAYASGNTSEMQRIKQILYKSGLYGSASEVIKDVNSWLKN